MPLGKAFKYLKTLGFWGRVIKAHQHCPPFYHRVVFENLLGRYCIETIKRPLLYSQLDRGLHHDGLQENYKGLQRQNGS